MNGKIKKIEKKVFLAGLFWGASFFGIKFASAAFEYNPMESVPGFAATNDFPTLIQNIYRFGIWTIGIAALFMVTWGGFTYMTSAGNTAKAGSGKQVITDALIGLVLALTAYLLFNIINPNLTNVQLQVTPTGAAVPTPPGPPPPITPPPPPPPTGDAAELARELQAIADTSGDCSGPGGVVSPALSLQQAGAGQPSTACNSTCRSRRTPCTASANLSLTLLRNLSTLHQGYPNMRIISLTGGQHTATSDHYRGTAADITVGDKSLWPGAVSQLQLMGCQAFCDRNGDRVPCPQATHIHASC